MKRYFVLFAAVAALTLVSCKHTPPPNVAAEVNGQAITYAELDKLYQTQYQQSGRRLAQTVRSVRKVVRNQESYAG